MRLYPAGSILLAALLIAGPSAAAHRAGQDWLCRMNPATDLPTSEFVVSADRKTLCVAGDCRTLAAPDRTHRQFRCGELEAEHRCLHNPLIVSSGGPRIFEEHVVIDLAAHTFEGEASGEVGDRGRWPYDRKFSGACQPAPAPQPVK
jgi:hypothetical protein